MQLNLHKATQKLPPPLAAARRILEVANMLSGDVTTQIDGKNAFAGRVDVHDSSHEVIITWWMKSPFEMTFKVDVIDARTKVKRELVNPIFLKASTEAFWKRLGEGVGNLVLDITKHGNQGPSAELSAADPLDDPDFSLTELQKHAIRKMKHDN